MLPAMFPGLICWCIPFTIKLHNRIISIGMSERTGKNRPICITSYIICCPTTFFRIVQSVRNPFITGFSIQHRLQGLLGKTCFHIAPVVFCYITISRIISITFGLPVTAMSTYRNILKSSQSASLNQVADMVLPNGWKVIK